jgi:hypothetical protein
MSVKWSVTRVRRFAGAPVSVVLVDGEDDVPALRLDHLVLLVSWWTGGVGAASRVGDFGYLGDVVLLVSTDEAPGGSNSRPGACRFLISIFVGFAPGTLGCWDPDLEDAVLVGGGDAGLGRRRGGHARRG